MLGPRWYSQVCLIPIMLSLCCCKCRETGEVWLEPCPNNSRTAEALLPLIQKHVKPGHWLYKFGFGFTLSSSHSWVQ